MFLGKRKQVFFYKKLDAQVTSFRYLGLSSDQSNIIATLHTQYASESEDKSMQFYKKASNNNNTTLSLFLTVSLFIWFQCALYFLVFFYKETVPLKRFLTAIYIKSDIGNFPFDWKQFFWRYVTKFKVAVSLYCCWDLVLVHSWAKF